MALLTPVGTAGICIHASLARGGLGVREAVGMTGVAVGESAICPAGAGIGSDGSGESASIGGADTSGVEACPFE
jgi:hypothetical protein